MMVETSSLICVKEGFWMCSRSEAILNVYSINYSIIINTKNTLDQSDNRGFIISEMFSQAVLPSQLDVKSRIQLNKIGHKLPYEEFFWS